MPTEPISGLPPLLIVPTLQALKLFGNNINIIWKSQLIAIKLGTYIMRTEPISAAHSVINGTNIRGS
jgi:hypothetical protein